MINQDDLLKIESQFKKELESINQLKNLEDLKVLYLGKKGSVTELLKNLGSLSIEEKKTFGKKINELKDNISTLIEEKKTSLTESLKKEKLEKESIDVTLPGKNISAGSYHPISLVIQEILRIFSKMGFTFKEGPELEEEYYNFDALNIPSDHPARDDQDSFYIAEKKLLRTQTSAVQIRVMEKTKPPLAIITAGKCFRRDSIDATHFAMFHQLEGLAIDTSIAFTDLKGTLALFAKEMFGSNTKVRFRPDFFPFTEPSAEFACSCFICGGKGCPTCKHTGWIEIGGCGMVDPEVFKYVNIDYEKYKGYAFGLGIERIAMIRHDIPDIRLFFENDVNFLKQFK